MYWTKCRVSSLSSSMIWPITSTSSFSVDKLSLVEGRRRYAMLHLLTKVACLYTVRMMQSTRSELP
jgi:hypothetical protein